MIDIKLLYPELVNFDGLPFTLQSKLAKSISDLKIQSGISFSKLDEMKEVFEQQGIYHSPARVATQNGKWANVELAIEQKLYILTLGDGDENTKVFIEVDSLDKAIVFLSGWLSGDKEIHQLEKLEQFRTLLNLDDDLQYIRWQWARSHRNAVSFPSTTGLLAPLFEEAMKDPVLSQITPYTSLTTLHLSRCTEFPFLTEGFPIAFPAYHFSQYHQYIVHKKNIKEAERLILILQTNSEFEELIKSNNGIYELSDHQGKHLFKGISIEALDFIVNYAYGKYKVMDNQGNNLETNNSKEAVDFLRNAIPMDKYPSIRGSAEDINL